jgi:transposase
MLADELDYVLGVDTHRDEHTVAVVAASAGAVIAGVTAAATGRGYRELLAAAGQHAPGRRVWAIEGSGSYGAGLARFLASQGEAVVEVSCAAASQRRLKGRTMPSARPGSHAPRSPLRRWRCRGQVVGGKPCGCC